MNHFNIAVDGLWVQEKAPLQKLVAKELVYFVYVDTGAMYRAMALYFLRKGVDPKAEDRKIMPGSRRDDPLSGGRAAGIEMVKMFQV